MGKIKNWILSLVAKQAAKKIKLEEGPMDDKKQWWKSKTVLSGIAVTVLGAYDLARVSLAPSLGYTLPEIPPVVYTFLGALGIYSRVTATTKIG